jgi:hypothetical protein
MRTTCLLKTLLNVLSAVIVDNRSLTLAAQIQCFRAARVSKRYAGHHTKLSETFVRNNIRGLESEAKEAVARS